MSLRIKLLLPLLLAGLLLAAQVALSWGRDGSLSGFFGGDAAPLLAAAALVLLLLVAFAIEFAVCRPLRDLARTVSDLPGARRDELQAPAGGGVIGELAADVTQVRQRLQQQDAELQRGADVRHKLERDLRDCQERYALTVERANDGIWELD